MASRRNRGRAPNAGAIARANGSRQNGVSGTGATGGGHRQSIIESLVARGMTREQAQGFSRNFTRTTNDGNTVYDWNQYVQWSNANRNADYSGVSLPAASAPGANAGDPAAAGGPDQDTLDQRQSVYDQVRSFFENLGLPADQLTSYIQDAANNDKKDWEIMAGVREQPWYAARFPGMAALRNRGQAMDEATYISQEAQYRQVLQAAGLPAGFYDDPTDFGGWIGGGVSVQEVQDRVDTAQDILNSADPGTRDALRQFYGITDGTMLAHILDPNQATAAIRDEVRAASIGGAAGGRLSQAQSEALGNTTVGQNIDTLTASGRQALADRMGAAQQLDQQDSYLSGIEQDNAYSFNDSAQAAFGDQDRLLASQKRAQREQARFGGSSAIGSGSLKRKRGY